MTTTPNSDSTEPNSPREPAEGVNDPELLDAVRDRALYEPLPSSEMFVACFAGARPLTGGDILDPAFDLVACQREVRIAMATLTNATASLEGLRTAGRKLVSARADIVTLVTIIDEAVRDRLAARCQHDRTSSVLPLTPAYRPPGVVVHTESVGDVVARMAELWELISVCALDPPEAVLLAELCDGYDVLAAEIEAGRRIPAGV